MCLRWLVYVTLAFVALHCQSAPVPLSQLDAESIKDRQQQYEQNPDPFKCVPHCYILACLSSELNRQRLAFALHGDKSSRKSIRTVQEWRGIPDFLAWKITTSSRQPILIPRATTEDPEEKVTLVVTASVIPGPPDRISYPKESQEVTILHHQSGGPGINTYPLLYVAPIEPSGWDAGTAVWAHILRSLQAEARNTLAEVNPRHFTLILAIAWANPKLSRMLYYKINPQVDPHIPIGYMLLNKLQKMQLAFENIRQVIPDGTSTT